MSDSLLIDNHPFAPCVHVTKGPFHLFVALLGDLVSIVTDLMEEDKNEDTLSVADSGVGTNSIITAATEVSGLQSYNMSEKPHGHTIVSQLLLIYIIINILQFRVACSVMC